MKTDFRNRVVLPIVLPVVVLLGIAVLVGGLALILLFNPREVSLTVALVVAAGVMVAFSLANGVDIEDMTFGRRIIIAAVAILPLVGGLGAAFYATANGLPRMIDVEPHLTAPEGALAGAKNATSFCVFEDPEDQSADTCTDTGELTFPAQPDAESFAYVFHNVDEGVPHNLQLFELAGSADAPEPGELVFGVPDGANIIEGTGEVAYAASPNEFAEGDQLYYNCVVHPVMQGVLTIGPPVEEGA